MLTYPEESIEEGIEQRLLAMVALCEMFGLWDRCDPCESVC
jgi:hypothetical protein